MKTTEEQERLLEYMKKRQALREQLVSRRAEIDKAIGEVDDDLKYAQLHLGIIRGETKDAIAPQDGNQVGGKADSPKDALEVRAAARAFQPDEQLKRTLQGIKEIEPRLTEILIWAQPTQLTVPDMIEIARINDANIKRSSASKTAWEMKNKRPQIESRGRKYRIEGNAHGKYWVQEAEPGTQSMSQEAQAPKKGA
jgi:hypothetical protein